MQNVKSNSGINKVYDNAVVTMILANEFKKGVHAAQVTQKVTTTYPSARITEDSLFAVSDFNIADGQSHTSTRTALIPVPAGITKEQVQNRLDAVKDTATLYKMISYDVKDVLSKEQIAAIDSGLQSKSFFENKFRITKKDGTVIDGDPQYQQHFYSNTFKEDQDFRATVPASFELKGEEPSKVLKSLDGLVNAKQY